MAKTVPLVLRNIIFDFVTLQPCEVECVKKQTISRGATPRGEFWLISAGVFLSRRGRLGLKEPESNVKLSFG